MYTFYLLRRRYFGAKCLKHATNNSLLFVPIKGDNTNSVILPLVQGHLRAKLKFFYLYTLYLVQKGVNKIKSIL